MLALLKKEIRSFLSSLIGYIVIVIFLLLTGLFLWVFPTEFNVINSGYADLAPFFSLAPLVFIFLIPAICMRSFAEEKRIGTIELLLTKPLSDFTIIFSKYLAGLLLVLFSLLPTLIYYVCMKQLGNPPGNIDSGAFWGSYIGLFFLGAGFVAIGIFASAITQNQIVAFIVSVFLCFFFFMGFDLIGSYDLFGSFDTIIINLGIFEHYNAMGRGVLDTRDLIYFLGLIAFFLLLTRTALGIRKWSKTKAEGSKRKLSPMNYALAELGSALAIIILIAYLGSYAFLRFDLTSEKRYTLAESTVTMLEDLEDVMYIKVYLEGDYPADYKKLRNATKEKLEEFRAYGGENIQYEFINIFEEQDQDELDKVMQQLIDAGLNSKEIAIQDAESMERKLIFPGAIINYKNKEMALQIVEGVNYASAEDINESISNLEYLFTNTFRKLLQPRKPSIAFIQGHGELDKHQVGIIVNELMDYATVEHVSIDGQLFALSKEDLETDDGQPIVVNNYDLAIIAKPDSAFSEHDKFVIDQFIMNGGRVMWLLEGVNASIDTALIRNGETWGLAADESLRHQLFDYGARVNANLVIDKECGPIDIPAGSAQLFRWYYYPLVTPRTDHPIVSNLDPIKMEFASTVDTVGAPGIRKDVILTTSNYSITYNPPVRINYNIIQIDPNFSDMNNKPFLPLAVTLEGEFKSHYAGTPVMDTLKHVYPVKDKSYWTKQLVIGDGDVMRNVVDTFQAADGTWHMRYYPLNREYLERNYPDRLLYYGNEEFLLNCIDYLLDEESLLSIRSRGVTLRLINTEMVMAEKSYFQFINIAGPITLIILFGVGQFFLRKKRYAK